jgi:hypothetical protein
MYKAPATQLSVEAVNDCVGTEPDIDGKAVGDSHKLLSICRKYRRISTAGGGEFLDQVKLAIAPLKDTRR